jgi:protein-tyrosine sulfotransferase
MMRRIVVGFLKMRGAPFFWKLKAFGLRLSSGADNADWLGGEYASDVEPIVVGGCGRSGTTLLSTMLDSHKNLCCGPESWLFIPHRITPDALIRNFGIPCQRVTEILQGAGSRGEFIDMFFRAYCQLLGKERWAEKTPKNVTQLDFIFSVFPRARFIHVIRDGRDVACSLRTHPRYDVRDGKMVSLNTWKPVEFGIARWCADVGASRKYWTDHRYLEVRYEDLVHRTRFTLEKILAFVNEAWDDGMLRYYEGRTASSEIARFLQNPEAAESVRTSSVGRWKQDFTTEDKIIFKRMAGKLLIELGYESSDNW